MDALIYTDTDAQGDAKSFFWNWFCLKNWNWYEVKIMTLQSLLGAILLLDVVFL